MKWKFPPRWSSTLFSLFCPVGKKNNQAAQHRFFSIWLTKCCCFFFPLLQKLSYCPTSLPWISLFHCVGNSSSTSLIHWDKYHVAYLLSHKVYQLSFHEVRKSLDRCNQVAFQKKKKKLVFYKLFLGLIDISLNFPTSETEGSTQPNPITSLLCLVWNIDIGRWMPHEHLSC